MENEGWVWFLVKDSQGNGCNGAYEICLHVIKEKEKEYRQTIQDWMGPHTSHLNPMAPHIR